jgi:hypothetical protein
MGLSLPDGLFEMIYNRKRASDGVKGTRFCFVNDTFHGFVPLELAEVTDHLGDVAESEHFTHGLELKFVAGRKIRRENAVRRAPPVLAPAYSASHAFVLYGQISAAFPTPTQTATEVAVQYTVIFVKNGLLTKKYK